MDTGRLLTSPNICWLIFSAQYAGRTFTHCGQWVRTMKESWNFENRKQDFNYSLYSFPAPRFHSIARLIRPYYSAGAVRTGSFQSPWLSVGSSASLPSGCITNNETRNAIKRKTSHPRICFNGRWRRNSLLPFYSFEAKQTHLKLMAHMEKKCPHAPKSTYRLQFNIHFFLILIIYTCGFLLRTDTRAFLRYSGCVSSRRRRVPLHAHPCVLRFSGSVPPIVAARVPLSPSCGCNVRDGRHNYSAVCKWALSLALSLSLPPSLYLSYTHTHTQTHNHLHP